jgi:hypothetical protein
LYYFNNPNRLAATKNYTETVAGKVLAVLTAVHKKNIWQYAKAVVIFVPVLSAITYQERQRVMAR